MPPWPKACTPELIVDLIRSKDFSHLIPEWTLSLADATRVGEARVFLLSEVNEVRFMIQKFTAVGSK